MCTLSYLPKSDGSFYFTSNRDEKLARAKAILPQVYQHGMNQLLYPKDAQAGGTWLVASSKGYLLCLLNGGVVKHVSSPPYRKSRGLILLEFFKYPSAKAFIKSANFEGIEPFTLIIKGPNSFHELRWTGITLLVKELDALQPAIWSSVTLYEPAVIAAREEFFKQYFGQLKETQLEDVINFHQFKGNAEMPHSILMNTLPQTQTLSISALQVNLDHVMFNYFDLLLDVITQVRLDLETNEPSRQHSL